MRDELNCTHWCSVLDFPLLELRHAHTHKTPAPHFPKQSTVSSSEAISTNSYCSRLEPENLFFVAIMQSNVDDTMDDVFSHQDFAEAHSGFNFCPRSVSIHNSNEQPRRAPVGRRLAVSQVCQQCRERHLKKSIIISSIIYLNIL